jgi:hypothetical protein
MVKAKFKVDGIFGGTIDGAESKRIEMSPVFASEVGKEGNACEENAIFGKYTPAGHISITIVNPAAFEQFEVNKEYYVDFFSVELSQEKEEEVEEQEVEKEEVETEDEQIKKPEDLVPVEIKLSENPGIEKALEEAGELSDEDKASDTVTVGMSKKDAEILNSTDEPKTTEIGDMPSQPATTEDHTIAEGEPAGEGTPAQTV